MSIAVMTAVWKSSPHKGEALIVLLALADWANDQGECWPSMPVIAQKARITEQAARRIIKRLETDGSVEVERGGGAGVKNQYRIKPILKVPLTKTVTGTLATEKGEPCEQPYKEEPSLEPSSSPASQEPFSLNGDSPKKKSDPRYTLFIEALKKYWTKTEVNGVLVNAKIPFAFNGKDGKNLNQLLKAYPQLTAEEFLQWLRNRANSDEVNHCNPIHRWICDVSMYADGPLNKFGKPQGN